MFLKELLLSKIGFILSLTFIVIGTNTMMSEHNNTNLLDSCFNGTAIHAVPSSRMQMSLIVLYSLTSLSSLIGNGIVIAVQLYGSTASSSRNIRKYLINLAISDITIGVLCVPFSYVDYVLGKWIFPVWLCPTVQFAQTLSVFITSVTLSIIGVERYMFALHPLSPFYRFLQAHTRSVLLGTWIAGSVYSYALFGQSSKTIEAFNGENGETYYECEYRNNLSLIERRIFMSLNFVLSFLMPLGIISFSYVAIAKRLLNCPGQQQAEKDCAECKSNWIRSTAYQDRIKTIKIMFTVIVLYTACWAPIKLYQFLLEFDILEYCSESDFYLLIYCYIACHWCAMANSFVNPLIYAIMNNSFRTDFRKLSITIVTYVSVLRQISSSDINSSQL